jgi:hypothetical protein
VGHLDSKEVSIALARLDPAYKAGLTACILLKLKTLKSLKIEKALVSFL